jgi:SAM-dependent methyltransferase
MTRTLEPELLDALPADHAEALGSRRDLRRINTLMGHPRILWRALKNIFPKQRPSRLLEIGAGDGRLLLQVAHRWRKSQDNHQPKSETQFLPLPQGEGRGEGEGRTVSAHVSLPPVNVTFIDLQDLLRDDTKAEFAHLNWHVRAIEADIFAWLNNLDVEKIDAVLANLVLHHFTDAQLKLLFSRIAAQTDAFVAIEPRRSRWALFWSKLLSVIGCNAVTCHDAPVSVRAGFTRRELSALWPRDGDWQLTEHRAGLFSHLFIAQRKQ